MMSSDQSDRVARAPQPSPGGDTPQAQSPALQLIYDTAPIGLAFLSPDCRYLHINQHLTEICGISVADHIGRRVRDTVPALADAVESIVASIMKTGEPVIGVEVAGQRPDETGGERHWVTYWHPLRGPDGKISGVNVAAEEITQRKRAEEELRRREEHIQVIVGELAHRTKNLLVVVMALAKQTARNAADVKNYQAVFTQRLQGLAHSHDLLLRGHWQGASFADLVAMQMQPFREENDNRIRTTGPAIMLQPDAVQNLGLVFHELATNASKHGALSVPDGVVSIEWSAPAAGERIAVRWQESGGPVVQPPQRRGFGQELIERIVPQVLKGSGALRFAPSGVSWNFEFPTSTS
ncbi:MAG: HWE histidine kinase domain-containing protein [Alphaproteobacteria bacterium]